MSIGNTQLVEYGILNEESDIRIHVCFGIGRIYSYETMHGVAIIKNSGYREIPVWQKGINTAIGYAVPADDLEHNCIKIPEELMKKDPGDISDLNAKGRAALDVVRKMLIRGMIPLPHITREVKEKDMQLSGCDIITICQELRIQIKCDYKGGDKHLGGTGNLFLQTKECNPFGIH